MKKKIAEDRIQKTLHTKPKKILIGSSEYSEPFLKKMSDKEIDKFWHKMSDDREIIPTIITMEEIEIIDSTDTD